MRAGNLIHNAIKYSPTGTAIGVSARITDAHPAYEAAHHVSATCHDSSGLSYANRQSAIGIVHMLWNADHQPWLAALRRALPAAGEGTLRHRLPHIRIRAKTGTAGVKKRPQCGQAYW